MLLHQYATEAQKVRAIRTVLAAQQNPDGTETWVVQEPDGDLSHEQRHLDKPATVTPLPLWKLSGALAWAGFRLRPSDSVFRSGPPIKSVLYWLRRHNGVVNEQMLEDLYYTDGPKG